MARIVALVVVAVLAAAPAAGVAATAPPEPQQSPFQQTPAPTQNAVGEQPLPAAPAPTQQTVDNGSLNGRETLLIAVGVVALIGGIWFVISRDATRGTAGRLPSADSPLGGSATRAARRSRRLSPAERKRRKRGRAAK
jgi:hypothetical protein